MPGTTYEAEEKIWQDLDQVFRDEGYILRPWKLCSTLVTPGQTVPLSSGFGYATPTRGIFNAKSVVGTARGLQQFDYIVSSLDLHLFFVGLPTDKFHKYRILLHESLVHQMATILLYASSSSKRRGMIT